MVNESLLSHDWQSKAENNQNHIKSRQNEILTMQDNFAEFKLVYAKGSTGDRSSILMEIAIVYEGFLYTQFRLGRR